MLGRRGCHHPGLCPARLRQDPFADGLGDPTGTGADRMGHPRWRRQRSATTVGVGPRGPRRPHPAAGVDLSPILRPSSFAWSAAEHTEFVAALVDDLHSLPTPIRLILDDVDAVTDPEALRGLQILAGNVPSAGPSRAVQQVRSAARAQPAAPLWSAPRGPGRPPALHLGRIGDPVGEGRSAPDRAPGAAAPPTNRRLGGRAATGRTRPYRGARLRTDSSPNSPATNVASPTTSPARS